jgi:hypothetical protein
VLQFIEDNWLASKRIQEGGSADSIAGSIMTMFSFPAQAPHAAGAAERAVWLDPRTGREVSQAAAMAATLSAN